MGVCSDVRRVAGHRADVKPSGPPRPQQGEVAVVARATLLFIFKPACPRLSVLISPCIRRRSCPRSRRTSAVSYTNTLSNYGSLPTLCPTGLASTKSSSCRSGFILLTPRPPRSTWPPLPPKTRRVRVISAPAGGWQHVRGGVRGSYVERHYLGALDHSHRVRWEPCPLSWFSLDDLYSKPKNGI